MSATVNPPSEAYLKFETAGRRSVTVMQNLLDMARKHGYMLTLSEAQFRNEGEAGKAALTLQVNIEMQDTVMDALELIRDLQKGGAAIIEEHVKDLDRLIEAMKGQQ